MQNAPTFPRVGPHPPLTIFRLPGHNWDSVVLQQPVVTGSIVVLSFCPFVLFPFALRSLFVSILVPCFLQRPKEMAASKALLVENPIPRARRLPFSSTFSLEEFRWRNRCGRDNRQEISPKTCRCGMMLIKFRGRLSLMNWACGIWIRETAGVWLPVGCGGRAKASDPGF
jgi:hypothetical protein